MSIVIFFYTWPPSRCIQNLKTLAYIGFEKSVTEIFVREKEKWKNKLTSNEYAADSFLDNLSYPTFVPNFIILRQVVAEKCLTEKGYQTDRQTSLQKKQKLYTCTTYRPTSYKYIHIFSEMLIHFPIDLMK